MQVIFADSRGKGLGDKIRSKSKELVEVIIREGASLIELVQAASDYLQKNPFDVIYIAGGACDITLKDRITKVISYTWGTGKGLQEHLLSTINSAEEKLRVDFPASKVVFCTLVASELKQIVKDRPTSMKEQEAVEYAVWAFNSRVFELNKAQGKYSPSLNHQVHRYCKRKRRAYYHHLQDGIHLTDYLKNKWADEFVQAFAHN